MVQTFQQKYCNKHQPQNPYNNLENFKCIVVTSHVLHSVFLNCISVNTFIITGIKIQEAVETENITKSLVSK